MRSFEINLKKEFSERVEEAIKNSPRLLMSYYALRNWFNQQISDVKVYGWGGPAFAIDQLVVQTDLSAEEIVSRFPDKVESVQDISCHAP